MFQKWKKLIYKLVIVASILGCSQKVYAAGESFGTFLTNYSVGGDRSVVSNYTYAGYQRYIHIRSTGAYTAINNTQVKQILVISNDSFEYSNEKIGVADSWSTATYGGMPNDFKNGLSSIYDVTGNYYFKVFAYTSISESAVDVEYDGTAQSWSDWLEEHPNSPQKPVDPNHLPFLSFGLKKTLVPGFPQLTRMKLDLTWDYTYEEVYRNNPSDYVIELIISARFKNAPTGIGLIRDTSDTSINDNCKMVLTNGGTNISANSFSWIYADAGQRLYATNPDHVNWGDNSGYFLYVRIRNSDDSKSSDYKVYNVAMNGIVEQEPIAYDKDGNQVTLPDKDIDIGNSTGNDGNGDGVAPPSYSQDASSSANADPTSGLYDNSSGNFNIATAIGTLKDIVNQLQQLPTLFATVFTFFPSWFLDLLVVSLSLFITIGVVKLIVK